MKRITVCCALCLGFALPAFAGSSYSSKNVKEVAPTPCPEFYKDNEWNISLWGTYAFTGTEYNPNVDLFDLIVSTTEGETVLGTFDKYLGGDHGWGGGGDIKYFFGRYFGVGVQGFVLDAQKNGFDIDFDEEEDVFFHHKTHHRRAVGSVLGTFTLRYPVPCTRFAPYAWAGVGAIWGGGESDTLITHQEEIDDRPQGQPGGGEDEELEGVRAFTRHYGSYTALMGQFGGGLEVRLTPHLGWMTDYSWNAVENPKNNFGMFRTGINFAF